MDVVNSANGVKIDLRVHEVPSEHQRLSRLKTSFFYSQRGFPSCPVFASRRGRKNPKSIDEAIVVELPVCHANMMGIAQKIVDAIHPESVPDDNLRKNGLPV